VISAALVLISDEFGLNEVQQELIVSCTVGAAIIGAAFAGPINDRFGRKPAIFASSIFFFVGAVAMALAPDFQILLVGRLIVGLGVGVASMSMPVYVSEAAPLQIRGGLVTCINVAITGGQFVSSIVGGIFSEVCGHAQLSYVSTLILAR
jgi:SP family myo-inositol transporter-like MFS transporter 13